jgi:hypothetical protein
MNSIQIGFIKESRIRSFPKILPRTFFVSGPKTGKIMEESMLKQTGIKALMSLATKMLMNSGISKSKAQIEVKKMILKQLKKQGMSGKKIGGTIFTNKQGKKVSVINREWLKKQSPELQRIVIQHEKLHTKPFIGHSETLAHLYGGLAGPKKTKRKAKGLFHEYYRLWRTRPVRAGLEHATVGSAGYGGYKGVKALTSKNDKKTNRLS